jgi:hypothetical protein
MQDPLPFPNYSKREPIGTPPSFTFERTFYADEEVPMRPVRGKVGECYTVWILTGCTHPPGVNRCIRAEEDLSAVVAEEEILVPVFWQHLR